MKPEKTVDATIEDLRAMLCSSSTPWIQRAAKEAIATIEYLERSLAVEKAKLRCLEAAIEMSVKRASEEQARLIRRTEEYVGLVREDNPIGG